MAESKLLTFFAEIFLTLAGFTGIVAVLGQRSKGKWRPVILIIAVPVIITLILNAAGLGFERTFAPYLLGLIAMLFGCCAMFVLLLRFVRQTYSRVQTNRGRA